jgi:hypothetical protein
MQAIVQSRVHIISRSGHWAVKKEGASRAVKVYQTKEDAILGSYPYLQMGYDLVIHRKDGSVEQFKRAESLIEDFGYPVHGKKPAARFAEGKGHPKQVGHAKQRLKR